MKYIPLPPVAVLSLILALCGARAETPPVRVACIGDSITHGTGAPRGQDYPAQLQALLGTGYLVRNFGRGGATLLRHGDRPYDQQPEFAAAIAFDPDIAVVMLGTNDTKPMNWPTHKGEFAGDYQWLVEQLRKTNPAMKIFLCRPTPVPAPGNYGINEPNLQEEIPIIDKLVADMHLREIDMHAALDAHPEDLPDRVHPNAAGAGLMAKAAATAITSP